EEIVAHGDVYLPIPDAARSPSAARGRGPARSRQAPAHAIDPARPAPRRTGHHRPLEARVDRRARGQGRPLGRGAVRPVSRLGRPVARAAAWRHPSSQGAGTAARPAPGSVGTGAGSSRGQWARRHDHTALRPPRHDRGCGMKSVWHVFLVVVFLNLILAAGFVAWLWTSGRMSKERLVAVYELFEPTVAEARAESERIAKELAAEQARQQAAARLEAAKAGPLSLSDRMTSLRQADERTLLK